MAFEDILADIQALVPDLRGKLRSNEILGPITWFRVGGPAQLFYVAADEDDLAYFLQNIPADLPVTVLGLSSNVIIRDGGIPGVVIRLGRGFNFAKMEEGNRIRVGTMMSDARLAQTAAKEGIGGLSFYRGIPGSIGGALRMNAGAHGGETKDFLIEARALDRSGKLHVFSNKDMGFSYRHCSVPTDYIFTEGLFEGTDSDPETENAAMAEVVDYREEKQPIKSRTGGSTFKNPLPESSWKLIDAAGCRGLRVGGAHVSEKHCNFLINDDGATAADIEELGEAVRQKVKENSGIDLHWEIRRLGVKA